MINKLQHILFSQQADDTMSAHPDLVRCLVVADQHNRFVRVGTIETPQGTVFVACVFEHIDGADVLVGEPCIIKVVPKQHAPAHGVQYEQHILAAPVARAQFDANPIVSPYISYIGASYSQELVLAFHGPRPPTK